VQAGIMLAQLDRLPTLLRRRREVARAYGELLAGLEQVERPHAAPDRSHPWQSYVLTVHPGLDRDSVALALRARGIGCTIGTYASHLQPVYGPQKPLPVSADLFARHLAIPMHANLTDQEVARVAEAVRAVVALPDVRR
jgi:perosamine synthetase